MVVPQQAVRRIWRITEQNTPVKLRGKAIFVFAEQLFVGHLHNSGPRDRRLSVHKFRVTVLILSVLVDRDLHTHQIGPYAVRNLHIAREKSLVKPVLAGDFRHDIRQIGVVHVGKTVVPLGIQVVINIISTIRPRADPGARGTLLRTGIN